MTNNIEQISLDDLSVFLAVCETGGFRKAATRLGLSPSSVSEKIVFIEQQLGVPLLIRTTRSVMPTEAGKTLAARIATIFIETRSALGEASSSKQEIRGVLKLNVTGAVMVDILPPLIDRYLKIHPNVRLEIMVDDRLIDATAAGCDAGIRYGEHLAQDCIAVPIGPPTQGVAYAASKSYLEACGMPEHPKDLLNHRCILLRFSSGALVEWRFEKAGEIIEIEPPGQIIIGVNGAAAAIELARNGHGIIATFQNWLDPYLENGELLAVLPQWWTQFEGPRLYFSNRLMSAPLRALVNLIEAERLAGKVLPDH